jgi:hypothetical protein
VRRWALPVTGRVVFLDVDLLIMRNIDALLNAIPEPLGRSRWNVVDGSPGVAAVTCKSRWGARFFNSGVMVFTPSLTALRALLELTRFATGPWYGSVPHAGERWPDVCSPREEPWAYKRILRTPRSASAAVMSRTAVATLPIRSVRHVSRS